VKQAMHFCLVSYVVMTVDGVAIDIPEINMSHVCIHLLYHSILYTVFSMHAFMKAPTLYIDFWV